MLNPLLIKLKDIIAPQAQYVAPGKADPVLLTGDATEWVMGDWVEVIAADTIDALVRPIGIVCLPSDADEFYQVDLGIGADGDEVVVSTTTVINTGFFPLDAEEIDRNTRIALRVASLAGGPETLSVTLVYKLRS